METFCLNKCGATVRYISDIPLKEYYVDNNKKMEFFDAHIVDDSSDIIHNVFYHDCNNKPSLQVKGNDIYISYPFSSLSKSIILYMGYHLLEKQFGEMNMCSCHSACVEKDGIATLLIGEAGAGKTSLAVNLCIKSGFSLISNDLTLIGLNNNELKTFGGTKFLNLRFDSVSQNMPFLKKVFNESGDGWTNKISVMAEIIGITTQYNPVPIENIIYIHCDNRVEKLSVLPGDTWQNNFLLYQNLSSHIRGQAATFIDKFGHPIGYIPSFDTEDNYNKRMEIIDFINKSQNYYYVNGNLDDIVSYINMLYQNYDKHDKIYVKRKEK